MADRPEKSADTSAGHVTAGSNEDHGFGMSFRVVLTASLIAASVVPLAAFGGIVMVAKLYSNAAVMGTLLLAALVAAAFFGLLAAAVAGSSMT